ncbi:hypothetical protein Tco_0112250, partial [Tanacetum coccineum]
SSDESVDHRPLGFFLGAIPIGIPAIPVISLETPVVPSVAPVVKTTIVTSPTG